jgi:hypothetical protein
MANLEQSTERKLGEDARADQGGGLTRFRDDVWSNPVSQTPARDAATEVASPTEIFIPPIPGSGSFEAESSGQIGTGSAERTLPGESEERGGGRNRGDSLNGQYDPRFDSTDLRNITQHAVDAVSNDRPMHQTQREITELLQQQMDRGFTNSETRHYFAHLDNMLRGNNTHLVDRDGNRRDIFIGLSETKGGWNVSIYSNPLDRSQQQLHPTFHVPRR